MKKSDFIAFISEQKGISKKEAADIVETFTECILEGLGQDGEVNITGFAKFSKKLVPARETRNPKTGEKIQVPAKVKIKASISSSFGK